MAVHLDLADIQGNVLVAYGLQGFYKGRVMVFHIDKAESGRKFVTELLPMITTAQACPPGTISGAKMSRRRQYRLHILWATSAWRSNPDIARHAGRIH